MNKSESILGTLKYLDDLSKRSAEKTDVSAIKESAISSVNKVSKPSSVKEKIIVAKKDSAISAAEPHLKQFAGMLSEEIANLKKLKQEELERIRQQEIERIRLEEAEKLRIKIEAEKERARLEEEQKERLLEAQRQKLEQERERIRLEEEKYRLQQEDLKEVVIEEQKIEKPPVEQIKEYVEKTYRKPAAEHKHPLLSEKKKTLKEQTDFVTFDDLKKHYIDFLAKINTQLASLGGGGEVLLKRLDDIDMSTIQDGDFISYDAATGKFVGGSILPGPEGTIEGGTF